MTVSIPSDALARDPESRRARRIARLRARPRRTPATVAALAGATVLALIAAALAFLWVLAADMADRNRARLDDLARLASARLEILFDEAEPDLLSIATLSASTLAVDSPGPATMARFRADLGRYLTRTPATGVGVFSAEGELLVEAGPDGAVLVRRIPQAALQGVGQGVGQGLGRGAGRERDGAVRPGLVFHAPVAIAGRGYIPVSLPLDDPAIRSPVRPAGAVVVFVLPTAVVESVLAANLPADGTVAAYLVNDAGVVLSRFAGAAVPALPERGWIVDRLPRAESLSLDGAVAVFGARSGSAAGQAWGREWLLGVTALPARGLRTVVLTRGADLRRVVGEGGTLLIAGLLPALLLLLVLGYATQNEWAKQDRDVEALGSMAERLRQATNLLDLGIVDWDVGSGEVVLSNGWRRLLGHAPLEVADEIDEWLDRLHPDDREAAVARYQELVDGRREALGHQIRLRAKDGRYLRVHERGGVARSPSGRVTHVLLVQEREDPIHEREDPIHEREQAGRLAGTAAE